jgi:hypothetical protein
MTFEDWWNDYAWKTGADISNHAVKAIAKAAWDAAIREYSARLLDFTELMT